MPTGTAFRRTVIVSGRPIADDFCASTSAADLTHPGSERSFVNYLQDH